MTTPWRNLLARSALAALAATGAGVAQAGADHPVQLAYLTLGVPEHRELTSEFAWTDAVAEIQGTLHDLGFYKGPIDGRLSPDTVDAIRKYRGRHGAIGAETTWRSMLTHMRAIGEAMRLQDSLEAARDRQVGEARSKLLGHAAARTLLREGARQETADATRDASVCFAAPTFRCLVDEVLENIRAVSREKYRNWALQDLIGVLAQAGSIEPMKDAVSRLTDARLILVSLRDGAAVMAASGRMDLAEEVVALLPDGRDRLRALGALARGWLLRGDRGAAREVADRLLQELGRLGDANTVGQMAAELAGVFARHGHAEQARRLLDSGVGPLERVRASGGAAVRSAVAMALAELGETDRAEAFLRGIDDSGQRRAAEMALVGAFARSDAIDRLIEAAERIDIARYRVVALCDAAREMKRRGSPALASRALDAAIAHLPKVEGEFATDFAWACIAEAQAVMGDMSRAEAAAGQIDGADLKARTLWRLLAIHGTDGQGKERRALEKAATVATESVDTFKRVSILGEVAAIFARSGRTAEAGVMVDQALRIVQDIGSRWWRARALCRVAAAVLVIESQSGAR